MQMNRIGIIVLAVGASVASRAQSGLIQGPFLPGSGNYTTVTGGDFEATNSLAWFGYEGGWGQGQVFRESQAAYRGDYGMRMTRLATFGGYASGTLTNLTVGETYVLSAFIKPDTVWQDGMAYIDVMAGAPYTGMGITNMNSSHEDKWHFAYTTFTVTQPSVVVRVVNATAGAGGIVPDGATTFWDDVAITPVAQFVAPTTVPEPATLISLGAALGVLARRRRR